MKNNPQNQQTKKNEEQVPEIDINAKPEKKIIEERIDQEVEQSFPASDPPSYSMPGNDDIKPGEKSIKKAKSSEK